ncbi:MAG: signal peptidase I [Acetobacteraceae bacterium]|nr:signal peptidase I [Acetobacteraceae bacterium]
MFRKGGWLRETAETVLIALVLALVVRTFVVESFLVEGPSMEPTLLNRERLLVNKFIYHFTRPRCGDIIVFRYPVDPRRDFVKRVVATGGETVEMKGGQVLVNGEVLHEPYVAEGGDGYVPPTTVPEGFLFVLGDHRAISEDSRSFGFVPLRNVKGKAFLVYWPPQRARVLRPAT